MDVFKQWALCVIITAAAGTFACAISPKGSTDKAVRAVVGIFVVATICAPLSELDFDEITLPAYAQSYEAERELNGADEYFLSAFTSAVEDEIILSASQYGANVDSIGIDASLDESCIIIHNIQIYIQDIDKDKQSDFSDYIENKLGAPVTLTVK